MLQEQQIAQIICAHGATITTTRATLQKAPNSLLTTSPDATANSDEKLVRILNLPENVTAFLMLSSASLLFLTQFKFPPFGFNFRQFQLKFQDPRILGTKMPIFQAKRLGLISFVEAACPSTISISCHAALSTGRINPEVTFRKVLRIVVSGKVIMCRAVFGDSLNECRDGGGTDFEMDRYTSRFFLKHSNLEKAFDQLATAGYRLIHSNTFAPSQHTTKHASKDDSQFIHHSQFVFHRQPKLSPPTDISPPPS
ncbi:Protein CBG04376 [Caenorhabditis briggsae]|uniref:Protein CBG04376 n=1 Tax=Caenorhabditis briggsae TaxID=6238 RepID=A8WXE1_CAEBR|nr:Protein CBG04376 [Caenorhabditis briggsae]CAP25093.2 Protein CBG04376 [Caenorhabditis briggsae]